MDKVCNIDSADVQTPGPIFEYEYEGEKHYYISDIYYVPANLVIEVKDGGSNPNKRNMPEYRGKQAAKEKMITDLGIYNYLRLTNNDFSQLLDILADIKMEMMSDNDPKQIKIHINQFTGKTYTGFQEYAPGATGVGGVGGMVDWRGGDSVCVVPYGLSNSFSGDEEYGISTTTSSNIIIPGDTGIMKKVKKKDFLDEHDHLTFIYTGPRSNIKGKTISEMVANMLGHKPMTYRDLYFSENFKVFDEDKVIEEASLIENGILKEADGILMSDKVFTNTMMPHGDYVIISQSPSGYYAHTPDDFFVSSDYYTSVTDIPDHIIKALDALYKQHLMNKEAEVNAQ
jgi:hypothetical protein